MGERRAIVCEGCGRKMSYVGQVHEVFDLYDFPDLCGYAVEVDADEYNMINRRAGERKEGE